MQSSSGLKMSALCFSLLLCLASSCVHNGSHSVVCKSLNLTAVPENALGDGVKSLQIVENLLEVLDDNCFDDYPSLSVLYLYSNQIRSIDVDAFDGLDELKHLDLSHNKIKTLDPDSFQENPKLASVSLRDNPLEVTSNPIISSNSINNLDLSSCNLTNINTRYFSGLPKLEKLNLRHNSLTQLPVDFFKELTKLKRIYLHGNPWRCDVMEDLLLGNQDVIADYKKIQCVASSSIPAVVMETQPPVEPTESDESSEAAQPPVEPTESDESSEEAEVLMIEPDLSFVNDDDVEDIWESKEVEVEVEQGSADTKTVLIYINIVMVVVVSLLLIAVVFVAVKQGYACLLTTQSVENVKNEEDSDGYLIPKDVINNAP